MVHSVGKFQDHPCTVKLEHNWVPISWKVPAYNELIAWEREMCFPLNKVLQDAFFTVICMENVEWAIMENFSIILLYYNTFVITIFKKQENYSRS